MVMTVPESAAGCAKAMDGKGKEAARSVAAWEEEASPSWVTGWVGDDWAARVVVAIFVMVAVAAAVAAVAAASFSVCEIAIGGASPVEAIAKRHRKEVVGGGG